MKSLQLSSSLAILAGLSACSAFDSQSGSSTFTENASHKTPGVLQVVDQINLVSSGSDATVQDSNLINAWGLAFNPAGAAWVSDNGTGLSTVYDASGKLKLTVRIPAPPQSCASSSSQSALTSKPTGQVFNTDNSQLKQDLFIFATEDGTIAGWQPSDGTTAVIRVDNSATGATYKGVTLASSGSDTRIYAANFSAGTIDAFDTDYNPIRTAGGFIDPNLPSGYAPFNVKRFTSGIMVAYALQDSTKHDDVPGAGNGYIDLFDMEGTLKQRLISTGALNAPWGMTITPSGFGNIPGELLIGNFGDGTINVYTLDTDSTSARFMGKLGSSSDTPLVIDGLWALEFGPGAGGFETSQLYFTAGPNEEKSGLFGRLEAR